MGVFADGTLLLCCILPFGTNYSFTRFRVMSEELIYLLLQWGCLMYLLTLCGSKDEEGEEGEGEGGEGEVRQKCVTQKTEHNYAWSSTLN